MLRSIIIVLLLFIIGCKPFIEKHGVEILSSKVSALLPHKDNQASVVEKLGSPGFISPIPVQGGGERWFYYSKKTSTTAFLSSDMLDQETIVLTFDDKKLLKTINILIGEAKIDFDKDQTHSSGYDTTLLRDVFGNFGRYSAKKITANRGD